MLPLWHHPKRTPYLKQTFFSACFRRLATCVESLGASPARSAGEVQRYKLGHKSSRGGTLTVKAIKYSNCQKMKHKRTTIFLKSSRIFRKSQQISKPQDVQILQKFNLKITWCRKRHLGKSSVKWSTPNRRPVCKQQRQISTNERLRVNR